MGVKRDTIRFWGVPQKEKLEIGNRREILVKIFPLKFLPVLSLGSVTVANAHMKRENRLKLCSQNSNSKCHSGFERFLSFLSCVLLSPTTCHARAATDAERLYAFMQMKFD